MGWGKIRKAIHKVADKVEPTAVIYNFANKNKTVANLSKNVQSEGVKGVAAYGGYAGVVAQVIPGVGTAVGAGLIAASVAAQIKLKQDAIAKQKRANKEQQNAWAAEDAATLAANVTAPDDAAFEQTTPIEGTRPPNPGASRFRSPPLWYPDRAVSDPINRGGNIAANFLNDVFPAPSTSGTTSNRLLMTGAAPSGSNVATTPELQTGAPGISFIQRFKTPLLVGALVLFAGVAMLAIARR